MRPYTTTAKARTGLAGLITIACLMATAAKAATGSGVSATGSLTSMPPSSPVLRSPANGAAGLAVQVSLTWRKLAHAATYEVQVSTRNDFVNSVFLKSALTDTTVAIGSLANNTLYYWRVAAVNVAGKGSYAKAWSFNTIVAAPTAPALVEPLDGAIEVAVHTTLTWNPADRATAYHLQVSTRADFTELFIDQDNITELFFSPPSLLNNATYYWRLRAKNGGGVSAFSAARSFTTIMAAPSLPTLVAPANGAHNVALSVALTWTAAAGATGYQVQVSHHVDFSDLLLDQEISATTFMLSDLQNLTLYYWRVRAKNSGGVTEYTSTRSFLTIIAVPSVPLLTSPADSARDQALEVVLTWHPAERATGYHVQVAMDGQFAQLLVDKECADTTCVVNGLAHQTIYYWRVSAGNVGGSSAYAAVRSFTTIMAAPGVPQLILPTDGAAGLACTTTLAWTRSSQAFSYHVQVSRHIEFSELVLDMEQGSDTVKVISGLNFSTLYYWRVCAVNSSGAGLYSAIWSFTTTLAPPASPQLLYPNNNKTTAPLEMIFAWSAVESAQSYQLQISRSEDFSGIEQEKSELSEPSCKIVGLEYRTVYYWRVRAQNSGGEGEYSAVFTFKTGSTEVSMLSGSELPSRLTLLPNYPNPFNPETTIIFAVPEASKGEIAVQVYNNGGQLVRRLYEGSDVPGIHSVKWDGRNQYGEPVSSGVYVCRVQAGDAVQTIKMIYMR